MTAAMTDTALEETGQARRRPWRGNDRGERRRRAFRAAAHAIDRAVRSPWFAYAMVLLLQLKVVWHVWALRDMTSGDTSSYFGLALDWYKRWRLDVAWSPLYLAFYGSLMHLTRDPFSVTILHRLLIVFAATAGVLAVLRRMLPHRAGTVGGGVVGGAADQFRHALRSTPVLPAAGPGGVAGHPPPAALGGRGRVGQGWRTGLLVFTMFFVRNERSWPSGAWRMVCLAYEFWRRRPGTPCRHVPTDSPRRDPQAGPWGPTLLRYALPPLLAVLRCCSAPTSGPARSSRNWGRG